jgi:molybdate transport system substrate-binding protein
MSKIMSNKSILLITSFLFLMLSGLTASANTLKIAVASNFSGTLHQLAERFEAKTGDTVLISSGSTGKLYTQIENGAPFDIFMAADEKRPDLLLKNGLADAGRASVYAQGKLIFVSNIPATDECRDVLSDAKVKHIAIANPKTAPYGAAAQQVMQHLGIWNKVQSKLVQGENIAQALQFVDSTSANAGFVAKSMLLADNKFKPACEWEIPNDLYDPINQKMVLLKQAKGKSAVIAFWKFMQSPEAAVIIRDNGYDVP